jgi:hypothetical protein
VAGSSEIVGLKQQIATVNRRLGNLEKRLDELTDELHDRRAPASG